jgi:hypothetical protein
MSSIILITARTALGGQSPRVPRRVPANVVWLTSITDAST